MAFAATITVDDTGLKANWTGDDVCTFNATKCDMVPAGYKALVGLDFNQYGLGEGLQLTGFLDALTDLQFFHANGNDFEGMIPDLSNLQNISEIDLSVNGLSGPFPTEVLDLPLIFLDIRFNEFEGELPAKAFATPTLQALYINNNKFTGPLPEAVATDIFSFSMSANQFTGPIPESLANWADLEEAYMQENQLTGIIPESLCGLTNMSYINVAFNPDMKGTLGPICTSLLKNDGLNITGTGLKAAS
ncbi:L domain-like protein [Sphaerulina musiva SO2202]|uniref:L domain-like protein n=1 Tax=Sphaerulina musiva (strain SO2202) TaxID=692275 RepID=M3AT02_SPHMS|nr:L domain-like protein [Sphaerulina musiva SO2202]EMF08644.1 L domain-like protein [Sphaerulina musiva SO2202]